MKLTQASVLGLLGASAAAYSPSPRRPSDITNKWPLYNADNATGFPATTDKFDAAEVTVIVGGTAAASTAALKYGAANGLKVAAYDSQPYACFRRGLFYFPTQSIASGWSTMATGGAQTAYKADEIKAATTFSRTFWQSSLENIGTLQSGEDKKQRAFATMATDVGTQAIANGNLQPDGTKSLIKTGVAASDPTTYVNGAADASWACCTSLFSQFECNSGIDTSMMTGFSTLVVNRLVLYKGSGNFNSYTGKIGCATIITSAAAGMQGVCDNAASTVANNAIKMPTYNNDLLLAAIGQYSMTKDSDTSKGVTEGTAGRTVATTDPYCDYVATEFASETAKAKTAHTSGSATTALAFNGYKKCTYQFYVVGGKGAPTLKFTYADERNFVVHWMEWSGLESDVSGAVMEATDDSLLLMGVYSGAGSTKGGQTAMTRHWNPFLKASSGTAWPAVVNAGTVDQPQYNDMFMKKWSEFKDTAAWVPGSAGSVYWVPNKPGLQAGMQYSKMDSGLLAEMQGVQRAAYAAFESEKGKYDGERGTYDAAVKDEKARLADFFKAGFDAPIKVPSRPCPPSRPAAYSGPSLNIYTGTDVLAASNLQYIAGLSGAFNQMVVGTLVTPAPVTKALESKSAVWPYFEAMEDSSTVPKDIAESHMSNRMGYMSASYDDTVANQATLDLGGGYAGRVYGRLGEGAATLPGGSAPFAWKQPTAAATVKAGMQVSLFPQVLAMTEMILDKKILIEVTPKAYGALSEYAAPAQPGAAQEPGPRVAAAYLAAASTVAAALALATLY